MTPIQSKRSEERAKGQKPPILILFNSEWLTLKQLAVHPDLKENKLNYDVLYSRFKNPSVKSMEELTRNKRHKGRHHNLEYDTAELTIDNIGHHYDKKEGEILAGFLSETMFLSAQKVGYWDFHRLGNGRVLSGFFKGLRPYFINKSEAMEKGWVIV